MLLLVRGEEPLLLLRELLLPIGVALLVDGGEELLVLLATVNDRLESSDLAADE